MMGAPFLPICPQCSSSECGPYRCRFSSLTHDAFRASLDLQRSLREAAYVDAGVEKAQRERLEGRPEDFGTSACSRSNKAGQ